jgi:small redox-active disulfide protein 2
MEIKVLGPGCTNCINLESNVKEAVKEFDVKYSITKVTDYSDINSYGVMRTPALVIDNKVVSSGKVISTSEIIEILKKNVK